MQNKEMKAQTLILEGRTARDEMRAWLKKEFNALTQPRALAIVPVGDDHASSAYIRQKILFGKSVGVEVIHEKLPSDSREQAVADCIFALSANPSVAGIIVQLPLPAHLERERILDLVPHEKDVDGLSSASRTRGAAAGVARFFSSAERGGGATP